VEVSSTSLHSVVSSTSLQYMIQEVELDPDLRVGDG